MSKREYSESDSELRARVSREMIADAVQIEREGNRTEIALLYHKPEERKKTIPTPFGLAIVMSKPKGERLIAELLDDIEQRTTPDYMDVNDKGSFFEVTLTYLNGRTW